MTTKLQQLHMDWKNLGFSFKPTEYMYVAHGSSKKGWRKGRVQPYGEISLSPAACVLNYGQGVFEGLKAYRSAKGKHIHLFRPEENAKRMRAGCERLCIPPLPTEIFLDGVVAVTKANQEYVPPYQTDEISQGALYIRPVLWGTGPVLGVAPASSYMFVVFASPVGPYFKGGLAPIRLKATKEYIRAAAGGTGAVKAIANYAVGMLPAQKAKQEGFQEILYLDAKKGEFLEEVGAANFFCIKNGELLTPELDGCILPGITRLSVMELARDVLKIKVVERKISLQEALQADEIFATGTAAIISPVGKIFYEGKDYEIGGGEIGPLTEKLYHQLVNIQHACGISSHPWLYPVL